MKAIARYLRLYLHFWQIAISQGAVYRVDSLLLFVAVALYLVQSFTFFSSLLRSLPTVGGWTLPEYTLLLATYSFNWGVFKLFYGRTMEDVVDKVFTGQLDYTLLRPINARFLSYFCPPLIKSVPSVGFNILFIIWVVNYFQLTVTPISVLLYLLYLFVGQVIIFSFAQIAVTTSFFTNDASEIFAIFENAWNQASYPGEAFSKSIFFLLSFVVPIILFASFPTRILLGKNLLPYEYFTPFFVATICLAISNGFYKLGIRHYTSAGG